MANSAHVVAAAYRHCEKLARSHYENFPTASLLLPRHLRPAVAAIYAFARHADDIADEGDAYPEVRLKQLDAWEVLLDRCLHAPVDHPIFIALADSIQRHHLPTAPLHDLLTAFRMDVSIHTYATFEELLFYCRHSANPIGRLLLALFKVHDAQAVAAADALCTALQLTNFWQDLRLDIGKGRCYLAEEWLRESGLSSAEVLRGGVSGQQLRPAVALALKETDSLFRRARPLLAKLPLRLRLYMAATWHGGRTILHALQQQDDPLAQRPVLARRHWLRLTPRVLRDTLLPPAAAFAAS